MTRAVPALDSKAFGRARDYLLESARPLERALFRHRFEGGPADDVLAALSLYRNPDGGFGHGLEPDFRLPASSAMATSVAFHALRAVKARDDCDLVRGAIGYLVDTVDLERSGWWGVPLAVNDHPHAPWWDRAEDAATDAFGNPDADLLAALHEHAALVPRELLGRLTDGALARLDESPVPLEPYTALCWLRFEPAAPAALRVRVAERLRSDARKLIDLDPRRREENHFQPFWLAERPDALLADLLREEVERNLDAEIERQHADGYWEPRWSWDDRYPEAWQTARLEWRGSETLRTVTCLAAWGR
ncbi:MAG: hypothetical protein O7A09_12760, partial [Proteobacteria bacterium]|nr:hypothetical protein [Pseudomonadota bacterium]